MEQLNIKAHIEAKNDVKNHLEKVWTSIVVLNELVGLSESTMKELQTKISSKIAQCDISIRDHQKLLKPYMNKEQQELLDEAYKNYLRDLMRDNVSKDDPNYILLVKEEFINKCKTDSEFSEKWGLKIDERELSLEERYDWFIKTYNTNLTRSGNQYDMEEILNSNNCPTKLIIITYNNETIESYEI
jgi:hypothetical protein